jgi:anti-sigma regulatory factor (Ser/Thr protein kinase)
VTPPATAEFELAAPAVAESVGQLRNALGDFARSHGAGAELVMAVQLATSEAMSNAVVHAFVDRSEPGTITLLAGREGDELWVLVQDDGSGMRPRPDSPGLGVGLPLMTRTADSLKLGESPDGGTEVAMRFALRAA